MKTLVVSFPTSDNTWQCYSISCWTAAGCLASSSNYWKLPLAPVQRQECPWAPVKAGGAGGKDKPWTSCWVSQGGEADAALGVVRRQHFQLCSLLCGSRKGNSGYPVLSSCRTQLHSTGNALDHDFMGERGLLPVSP